jgi:hypothetical protein
MRIEGERSPLRPTAEHPFWVKQGNATSGAWVQASHIKVGDEVLTVKGDWRKVTALSLVEKEQIVYNFEVDGNHDYFVGISGVLAHNPKCDPFFTDSYGKVHVDLPDRIPSNWTQTELEESAEQLEQSIANRINETAKFDGGDAAHWGRIRQEQQLLRQILDRLGR